MEEIWFIFPLYFGRSVPLVSAVRLGSALEMGEKFQKELRKELLLLHIQRTWLDPLAWMTPVHIPLGDPGAESGLTWEYLGMIPGNSGL